MIINVYLSYVLYVIWLFSVSFVRRTRFAKIIRERVGGGGGGGWVGGMGWTQSFG